MSEEYKVGDIVGSRLTIYKVIENNLEKKYCLLQSKFGDIYKQYYSQMRYAFSRINLTKEEFDNLPLSKLDWPDSLGINPHNTVEDLEGEVWYYIRGMKNKYQISNMGRIKSLQDYGFRDNHRIISDVYKMDEYEIEEPIVRLSKNRENGFYYVCELAKNNMPQEHFIDVCKIKIADIFKLINGSVKNYANLTGVNPDYLKWTYSKKIKFICIKYGINLCLLTILSLDFFVPTNANV